MAKAKAQQERGRSKFQKFESRVVCRTELNNAPYNPRQMRPENRKRLEQKIRKHGLVEPPVWNARTGNLVGGHQRLAALDVLEGRDDYELTVSVIDVSEREEKELNVQLNNLSMQGDWDLEALAQLHLEDGIGFEDMGFSNFDVDYLFQGDERFGGFFEDVEEVKEAKDTLRDIKEHRKEATARMEQQQQADYYFVVVCESGEERDGLLRDMGIPVSEEFVRGSFVRKWAERE